MRFKLSCPLSAVLAGVLLATLPALAVAQGGVEAVWAPRHVKFVYQGFTTRYSCEGLREKIHEMLSKLGARDVKVRPYGCIGLTGVEPFPGVKVTMRVLVPATVHGGRRPEAVVPSHWRDVSLMRSNADPEEQGNCELIEQFKETFLPLFATRHIRYQSNCIPHQLTLGTHLSAQVLIADAAPARGE